jgi:hypothetical protein
MGGDLFSKYKYGTRLGPFIADLLNMVGNADIFVLAD